MYILQKKEKGFFQQSWIDGLESPWGFPETQVCILQSGMADRIIVRGKDGKRVALDLYEGVKGCFDVEYIAKNKKGGGSAYAVCIASVCMYVCIEEYVDIYI